MFAGDPESQQEDSHKNFDARPETQITKAEDTATKMAADDASNRSGGSNHSSKAGASSDDDSSRSSFHTNSNGSTTGTGTTGPTSTVIPEAILATKETRAVHYSRIVVLAVLALSATVAGGLTFWLFSESEKGDFAVQVSTFYFMLD